MVGEWHHTTLGSIATKDGYGLVDGPFGSNLPSSLYTEGGVPVIRGSNLTLGTGRFRAEEFVFVSSDTAKRLERSICRPLDIVFTKKGTLGQTGLVPEGGRYNRYLLSSNQMKLTVNRRIADPLFVYYFVSSPDSTRKVIRDSEATGVPKTNVKYLREFPIALPPLSEQRSIAHILGTLDDKIDLNRRMCDTLEVIARALFRSWFVDFDPVRANVDGCYLRVPQQVADLFPDAFTNSELGEIPVGWKAATLKDFSNVNPQVWSKHTRPEKITYVDLSNTKLGCIGAFTVYDADDAPSRAQRVLEVGDTIVGTVRPGNGSYAIISDSGLTGSTGFAVLRPRTAHYTTFVYLAATCRESIDSLAHVADGGAYPAVHSGVVASVKVVAPDDVILRQFSQITVPMFASIAQHERESRTLAELRDTLLPKLLSGELRVKSAERLVADVL